MKPRPIPLALLVLAAPLAGQWSASPSTHLAVGDGSGEQVLPKLAATADGGCYLAWFDGASGSYAVRLQRLDAAGVEQWPHQGVLVSNQPQSTSLVDWDLITDSAGAAVLCFTDIRAGGDLDVYAYRIAPSGAMLWGAQGVALSNDGEYEANPRVVEASDGDFVFVWTRTSASSPGLAMQRLDPAGNPRHGPNGLTIPADGGATPGFATLCAGDAGSVIVAWMRDISFRGLRHLHAQKFDAAGAPLWGSTRLSVFDQASLGIAHQVRMVGDGRGGAVLAWHFAPLSIFSTRVQHLSAAGLELFPHDGIDISAEVNVSKLDPALVHLPARGETAVVFHVRNPAQSAWGVAAQKLDAQGQPLWGPDGVRLAALDGVNESGERALSFGDGLLAFWFEKQAATPQTAIRSAMVDGAGQVVFGSPPLLVSTPAAEKLHLVVDATPSGTALLAWSDRRNDGGDVLAQNLNPDGSLGADLAELAVYGCGVNPAGSLAVGGSAAIGGRIEFRIDNPLGTQAPGRSTALLALAFAPDPNFPCGTAVPGWGMGGGPALGELLLDYGQAVGAALVAGPWTGSPARLALAVPLEPGLAGARLFAQGVIVDGGTGATAPIGMADAARIRIGF
jgi:hypothetical protein